ncbi:MAG: hypothetical protein ACREOW_07590 [Thermodesulfobacteriota bacterium]
MKPKICIILTPEGIDAIGVLSKGTRARKAGYTFCSFVEDEFHKFEQAIRDKVQTTERDEKSARGRVKQ